MEWRLTALLPHGNGCIVVCWPPCSSAFCANIFIESFVINAAFRIVQNATTILCVCNLHIMEITIKPKPNSNHSVGWSNCSVYKFRFDFTSMMEYGSLCQCDWGTKGWRQRTIKLARCHNAVDYHNWLLSCKQNAIIMAAQCSSHLDFYRRGFRGSA